MTQLNAQHFQENKTTGSHTELLEKYGLIQSHILP